MRAGSAACGSTPRGAGERGLGRLGLWAPAHSPAAIALYTRAGFRETGERRPIPTNPSLWIVAMERELSR